MANTAKSKSKRSVKGMIFRLTAGNLAYLAAQFLAFVALTQWTTLAEVGRFSWALALTSPVFLFADMRTSQIQLSSTSNELPYRTFVYQRCLMQLLAAPTAIILGNMFSPDGQTQMLVYGLTFLKFIEGFINTAIAEHMRHEDTGIVAIIQVVRGALYACTFSVAVFSTGNALVAVWTTATALLVPAVIGIYLLPRTVRTAKSYFPAIGKLTQESWSIGLGFFLGSLTVNAPRFLVEEFHGVESLGVYSAVAYVIVLANTVVDSVTQGLMPRFSLYWRQGQGRRALREAYRICLLVGSIGLLALIVAYFFGSPILQILFGGGFSQGGVILVSLFAYATLQYVSSAIRSVLIAGGTRSAVFWTSFLNFTVTMAFALAWVPNGGPESAGWALAVGQFAQLIAYLWLTISRKRETAKLT